MRDTHLIYGPPGTGKSTEIVNRLNNYIQKGIDKSKIGLCSYTKAAAQVLVSKTGLKSKYVGTIHSLAFKQAGCTKAQTVTKTKLKGFSEIVGIDFTGCDPDETDNELQNGDYYMYLYGLHQARLSEDVEDTYQKSDMLGDREEFLYFVASYVTWKKENGYIDYNDMLNLALNVSTPDIDVLFIDEAQDLSPLQWRLIEYWMQHIEHIHIAGDDDQAIYEWAGANPAGMLEFENRYKPNTIILQKSHRVPKKVHTKAINIVNDIVARANKIYSPLDTLGTLDYYSEIDEIPNLENKEDVLILYRNHNMRELPEDYLMDMGLPYHTANGRPGPLQNMYYKAIQLFIEIKQIKNREIELKEKEWKLLTRTLHENLAMDIESRLHDILKLDWKDALYIPDRFLTYYSQIENNYSLLDIEPNIHLSTIHGAKGKEADCVILYNGMGERAADAYYQGETCAEKRVFYVGVTRTKNELYIIQGDNGLDIV